MRTEEYPHWQRGRSFKPSPLHAISWRLPQLLPRNTARLVSTELEESHVSMTSTPASTVSIFNQCALQAKSAVWQEGHSYYMRTRAHSR